jgi:hypothetical protein
MPNRIIRDALLDSERYLNLAHDSERLLFFELLLCADDYGLVPVNYTILRRKCSPCFNKSKEQVLKMLSALADVDLIRMYESDGSRYAYIPRGRNRPQSIRPKWPAPPHSLCDDAIVEAQRRARNLNRNNASAIKQKQQPSEVEQRSNTVATVCEQPNTYSNAKTKTNSEANASGAKAPGKPVDLPDMIFGLGVPLLTGSGVSEQNARKMLGMFRKQHQDDALIVAVLQRCAEEQPMQPVSWIQAALKFNLPGQKKRSSEPAWLRDRKAAIAKMTGGLMNPEYLTGDPDVIDMPSPPSRSTKELFE